MLLAGLVDKVGAKLFDGGSPAAGAFGTKVLEGEIFVIGVDSNLGAFEKRAVFFESLNTREYSRSSSFLKVEYLR